MADPTPSGPRKWLWPLLIALLAVLLLVWLFNPSGNEDTGAVEDPIVTPELEADATQTQTGRAVDTPPPPAE